MDPTIIRQQLDSLSRRLDKHDERLEMLETAVITLIEANNALTAVIAKWSPQGPQETKA
jgi:ribosomal 50S subunit-associated protein YjgA (DUF615 family)